jgi:putative toxin-antitoxin system antitoxin component (TIGR02293 family)
MTEARQKRARTPPRQDGANQAGLNSPELKRELARPAAQACEDESAVLAQAIEVIGDKPEAMRWMGTPVRDLDYATPVSLLGTRQGRQAVITVLGRLEHGVL